MALEDFKWRMVHLIWYILLSVGLAGMSVTTLGIVDMLQMTAWNIGFVLLLLFVLTLYISVKERKLVLPFDSYLGWGDVLFFICIALYLDLGTYILFMIGSLIVALILTPFIYRWQGKEKHVPLAGIQAICLLLYLPFTYFKLFHMPVLIPGKL